MILKIIDITGLTVVLILNLVEISIWVTKHVKDVLYDNKTVLDTRRIFRVIFLIMQTFTYVLKSLKDYNYNGKSQDDANVAVKEHNTQNGEQNDTK